MQESEILTEGDGTEVDSTPTGALTEITVEAADQRRLLAISRIISDTDRVREIVMYALELSGKVSDGKRLLFLSTKADLDIFANLTHQERLEFEGETKRAEDRQDVEEKVRQLIENVIQSKSSPNIVSSETATPQAHLGLIALHDIAGSWFQDQSSIFRQLRIADISAAQCILAIMEESEPATAEKSSHGV